MKKLFYKDLTQKSIKELVAMRKDLKKELFELKNKNLVGALKQTHSLRIIKRNIAVVQFTLHDKIKKQNGDNGR